jgi:hypothetical protein
MTASSGASHLRRRSSRSSTTSEAVTLAQTHPLTSVRTSVHDPDEVEARASLVGSEEAEDGSDMLLGAPNTSHKTRYGRDPSATSTSSLLKRRGWIGGFALVGLLVWLLGSRDASFGPRVEDEPPLGTAADHVVAPLPKKRPSADPAASCIPVSGKPEHQYALMIDAGSTGSRIHIYDFRFCADPNAPGQTDVLPTLAHEGFFQRQGGLSSFRGKPKEAAERCVQSLDAGVRRFELSHSLRMLLEEAVKGVPQSEHHCTPIAVKATAGLRLLGTKESDAILRSVRSWLETEWPFPVVPGVEGVGVMEGRDEGVYAWITINYVRPLQPPIRPYRPQ